MGINTLKKGEMYTPLECVDPYGTVLLVKGERYRLVGRDILSSQVSVLTCEGVKWYSEARFDLSPLKKRTITGEDNGKGFLIREMDQNRKYQSCNPTIEDNLRDGKAIYCLCNSPFRTGQKEEKWIVDCFHSNTLGVTRYVDEDGSFWLECEPTLKRENMVKILIGDKEIEVTSEVAERLLDGH